LGPERARCGGETGLDSRSSENDRWRPRSALSIAGIPANALIEASVAFGDGVMRFKQAFSCDADIGD